MEHAATKLAALSAAMISLLVLAAPALAAPSPEPAPHQGSGPQPEPSGGGGRVVTVQRAAAAPQPAASRVTVVHKTTQPQPQPRAQVHKPRHRRHTHHAAPAVVPRSAPSATFNSLRTAVELPDRADTASGIDSQKFALAAAALLILGALGGSLMLLALIGPPRRT